MSMKLSKASIKTLFLNFPLVCKLLWGKATRPFRKLWMNILLSCKKQEAKFLHRVKGVTHYVVMMNWHDIRVMNKGQYDYCKKFIRKKYGKDLSRHVMYRADGTLIKKTNWVGNL